MSRNTAEENEEIRRDARRWRESDDTREKAILRLAPHSRRREPLKTNTKQPLWDKNGCLILDQSQPESTGRHRASSVTRQTRRAESPPQEEVEQPKKARVSREKQENAMQRLSKAPQRKPVKADSRKCVSDFDGFMQRQTKCDKERNRERRAPRPGQAPISEGSKAILQRTGTRSTLLEASLIRRFAEGEEDEWEDTEYAKTRADKIKKDCRRWEGVGSRMRQASKKMQERCRAPVQQREGPPVVLPPPGSPRTAQARRELQAKAIELEQGLGKKEDMWTRPPCRGAPAYIKEIVQLISPVEQQEQKRRQQQEQEQERHVEEEEEEEELKYSDANDDNVSSDTTSSSYIHS